MLFGSMAVLPSHQLAADTLEMDAKRSECLADMIEAETLREQLMEFDVNWYKPFRSSAATAVD